MNDAVIVSTARTPIGKAYRGTFNDTQAERWPRTPYRTRLSVPALLAKRSVMWFWGGAAAGLDI